MAVVTTTRTGPISENTQVAGMTWGEWKASDGFDIETFTDGDDYSEASNADQKLFDALIDAQEGDEVLATTESLDIVSAEATVEVVE